MRLENWDERRTCERPHSSRLGGNHRGVCRPFAGPVPDLAFADDFYRSRFRKDLHGFPHESAIPHGIDNQCVAMGCQILVRLAYRCRTGLCGDRICLLFFTSSNEAAVIVLALVRIDYRRTLERSGGNAWVGASDAKSIT